MPVGLVLANGWKSRGRITGSSPPPGVENFEGDDPIDGRAQNYLQHTPPRHRVQRVQAKIEEQVLNLWRVRLHRGRLVRRADPDLDALVASPDAHQRQRRLHDRADWEQAALLSGGPREVEEPLQGPF